MIRKLVLRARIARLERKRRKLWTAVHVHGGLRHMAAAAHADLELVRLRNLHSPMFGL